MQQRKKQTLKSKYTVANLNRLINKEPGVHELFNLERYMKIQSEALKNVDYAG